jgi:bifunctional DNase/RNase
VVRQVSVDPGSGTPVVLLEDRGRSVVLPIWIGPGEARAIAMRLEGIVPPRPMTHDLLENVLERLGIKLRRVVIGELREDTYHASLILEWRGNEYAVDSRPSDAIALALGFGEPIFVSASLLEGENAVALAGPPPLTLGGLTFQALSADLAEHFRLSGGRGVLVSDAGDGGPLRRGDVVLEVDGQDVMDPSDFREKVVGLRRSADLLVQRNGNRIHLRLEPRAID